MRQVGTPHEHQYDIEIVPVQYNEVIKETKEARFVLFTDGQKLWIPKSQSRIFKREQGTIHILQWLYEKYFM